MTLSSEARIWIMLISLTIANWLLVELGMWNHAINPLIVDGAILLLALIKVRLIVHYFMEVRTAPKLLGYLFDLWLAMVALSLMVQTFI